MNRPSDTRCCGPETRERLARVEEASRYQADRLNAHHDRLTALAQTVSMLHGVAYRNKAAIIRMMQQITPLLVWERSLSTYKAAGKLTAAGLLFAGVATGKVTQDTAKDWRDWLVPGAASPSRR